MQAGDRSYVVGRAVEWTLSKTSNGNDQIVVTFNTDKGRKLWFGSLTEAAADYTLEGLENCGWDGRSISRLDGMGSLDVELVLDVEEYEGKLRERVRFVNKMRAARDPLDETGVAALEKRLAGKLAERQKAKGEDFKDPFA